NGPATDFAFSGRAQSARGPNGCMMTLDSSELARQLAARRKRKQVICPICGTVVVGVGRRTYCSEQCAKLAWWRRHRSKAARLGQHATAIPSGEDDGGAMSPPQAAGEPGD